MRLAVQPDPVSVGSHGAAHTAAGLHYMDGVGTPQRVEVKIYVSFFERKLSAKSVLETIAVYFPNTGLHVLPSSSVFLWLHHEVDSR